MKEGIAILVLVGAIVWVGLTQFKSRDTHPNDSIPPVAKLKPHLTQGENHDHRPVERGSKGALTKDPVHAARRSDKDAVKTARREARDRYQNRKRKGTPDSEDAKVIAQKEAEERRALYGPPLEEWILSRQKALTGTVAVEESQPMGVVFQCIEFRKKQVNSLSQGECNAISKDARNTVTVY